MGTKVHSERYLPGFYLMRDLNEGCSSSNWPLIVSDKSISNGQYRNGYLANTLPNSYCGGDIDAVRQTMLKHEGEFQHQVSELHRLYKIQTDWMEENKIMENAQKVQNSKFPYLNSNPRAEINSSPLCSPRRNINQVDRFLPQNGYSSMDCEILEVRPSKARKKLFDLQIPGDKYVEPENQERYTYRDTYISSSLSKKPVGLTDLNKAILFEGQNCPNKIESSKSSHFLLGLSKENLKNPQRGSGSRISNNLYIHSEGNRREIEGRSKTNPNFISQGTQRDYSLVSLSYKPILDISPDLSSLYYLKPVSTSTQNLNLFQNSLGTSNTSSQLPSQHQDIVNRLYCGRPPSWIKDPLTRSPLTVFENSNLNKYNKVASERSINFSPSKVNSNACPSKSSCIEIVDVEKESENQIKILPFKGLDGFSTQKISKNKLFGVPIFNKSSCMTKESSSLVSTSASLKDKGKNMMIDINVACDIECSTEITEANPIIIEKKEKEASFQALFDLNSCVNEDEITITPSLASTNVNNKRIGIDLEAPPVPDSDEDILIPLDEAALVAAKVIITISSSAIVFESPSPDLLLWFVDVVCDNENPANGSKSLPGETKERDIEEAEFDEKETKEREIDEFEAATLNQREMTEEEYMPKPLPKPDENAISGKSGGQTRKGAGRRGGRKRDFQREILPGMATLSRHEVSEDIHTFASVMRETGYVWTPQRNGSRGGPRGRRRATSDPPGEAVDLTGGAVGLPEEAVAVSGNIWGETPKRPRRQRGGASNLGTVHLG